MMHRWQRQESRISGRQMVAFGRKLTMVKYVCDTNLQLIHVKYQEGAKIISTVKDDISSSSSHRLSSTTKCNGAIQRMYSSSNGF